MSTHKYMTHEKLLAKRLLATQRRYLTPTTGTLPCSGSVKSQVQEVYDQNSEGSCTANAYCAAYRILNPDKTFIPSRQYFYWKERLIEDGNNPTNVTDSGANVEDGVSYVTDHGICSETSWPYNTSTVDTEPPATCDVEAENHKLGKLYALALGNLDLIKQCIIRGVPVLIAFAVYSSFESTFTSKTGIVTTPHPITIGDAHDPSDPCLGGHETLIVGYTDATGYFTVLNSWGTGWGNGGYFYLPYSFVLNSQFTYQLCCLA